MKYYIHNNYTEAWDLVDPQDPLYQDCDWESMEDWYGDDCMVCLSLEFDRNGHLVVA